MLYLKSYCYSIHELPFIIANLQEGYNYIDKLLFLSGVENYKNYKNH